MYLGHIIGLYGGGCLRGAPSLFVHRKVGHSRDGHRIHAFAAQRRFSLSPIKIKISNILKIGFIKIAKKGLK
jgi:hypothetical protein